MVMNMNMKTGGDGGINTYLSDTVSSVFENVYTVPVTRSSNVELFASDGDIKAVMAKNVGEEKNPDLNALMVNVYENLEEYIPGDKIMTDDKAPVELLGMKAIDALIFDEADYYKKIFRRYGFKGLIESLS